MIIVRPQQYVVRPDPPATGERRAGKEEPKNRLTGAVPGRRRSRARVPAAYWESEDLEDLARNAARPDPSKVPDITRAELAEIVRRIVAADPESDYYLALLGANVPHSEVGNLIFWPPPELRDATAEEIVEAALRYRPIPL